MVYLKMQRESLSHDNKDFWCAVLYWDQSAFFSADTHKPFNTDFRHSGCHVCCPPKLHRNEILESGWSNP